MKLSCALSAAIRARVSASCTWAFGGKAFQDDTVGRGLERLYATGTMKVFTACAVRADRVFGFDKRYVHFDTTSLTVYGDYRPPEETPEQEVPFRITYG